ncbi:type II toxin-antitoxin system RelE/ParE family toxin [Rhodoferax sp. GW822-FHT02A01]|uniref:type II toxin-antitoxin system RelE/ParE family toxin n=1 Tax=Rhodoferax sp. GW822-FHT02A01 TaxID=3141537 RepID=UPI00315DEF1C
MTSILMPARISSVFLTDTIATTPLKAALFTVGIEAHENRGQWRKKDLNSGGIQCVSYAANFADAVYVLYRFQKKTVRTSKADLDLVSKRCHDLLKALGL